MEKICLACRKTIEAHRKFTQVEIDDSKGATYKNPKNGYLSPLSPSLIGKWIGHDPVIAKDK